MSRKESYQDSNVSSPSALLYQRRQVKLQRDYTFGIAGTDMSPYSQLSQNWSPQVRFPSIKATKRQHDPLVRKMSVKSQNCWTKIKLFAQETSIHGIWHILRQDRHWFSRVSWFCAFSICFVVCSWLITFSVIRYLTYDVKTTTSVVVASEIDFPAITFCNENIARKGLVGSNLGLLKILTAFIVRSRDEFNDKFKEVLKTCRHPERNDTSNNGTQEEKIGGYEFWRSLGIPKVFSMLSTDSYYSVFKCWWKNKEQNCSDLFLNHMTDHGWCFTVNPHPHVVKSLSLGLKPTDTAYGLQKDFNFLKLISSGPNNNLRLMLNVHQEEYCVSQHDTAGFKILIHNPRIQPLFFLDRPIYLTPGYETHIGVRYRREVKLTEHLGKCAQFKTLKLYPNATVYFKEACYLECFSRNVYKSCNCVPAYGPPRANYLIADELGFKYVNVCFSEMLCMKDYEHEILEKGLTECSHCVDPCNNTDYDFHISYSYFPSKESFAYYHNLTGAHSLEDMRDNYVVVDIYVENMQINVVTETQDFTIESLVADMGGQLGFLLGMSVLSLFEFVQFIMPNKSRKKLQKLVESNKTGDKNNKNGDIKNSNYFSTHLNFQQQQKY